MKRLSALIIFILLAMLCLTPWPCSAQAPQTRDLPLLPVGSQGFVDLLAFEADYGLGVGDEQWTLTIKHTYRFHNTDRIKAATLRLGLEELPAWLSETDPVLRDADGTPLVPIGMDAAHPLIWEIQLAPNQQITLEYGYSTPASRAIIVDWALASAQLREWGLIQGTYIAWRLPAFFPDQILLDISPSNRAFDGRQVTWSAENVNSPEDTAIRMWSPQLWKQRQDLLTREDHAELARFYADWADQAADLGVEIDLTMEILGAYQAALVENDQDTVTRAALAQLYLDLADRDPSTRLNYLVLAAEEFERVHAILPDDTQVIEQLVRIYDQAAALAGAMGDPAGALAYLVKPAALSTGANDAARREELALQWALDLAELGQIDKALLELSGRLAPAIEDAIMRYAPPCMSAATRVTLTDHQRTVVYRIYLYLPTAESTHARLTELTERLVATEQCTTSIVLSDSQAMVTVDVTFDSLEELADIGAALSESLAQDPDLISALLGAPWGGSVDTWQYPRTLWQDQFVYREHIDKSSVDTLWQTNAQYAEWRLIELADAPAETERARMEKRLAQIALNEQRLIWEYLPRSSYWVYAVAPENTPWTKETLVPWGQQRVLEAVHSVYRWRSVALTALLAGACLGTMVVVTLLVRRKRLR